MADIFGPTMPAVQFSAFRLTAMFLIKKQHYNFLGFFATIHALLLLSVLGSISQPAFAQGLRLQDKRKFENTIVIGKLVGHHDYRFIKVRLREGNYLIRKAENPPLIHVLTYSPEWLQISIASPAIHNPDKKLNVLFQFFPNERSLMTALILDQVDYTVLRTEQQAREVQRANSKILLIPLRVPPNLVEMIVYNLRHPILRDRQVREAISLAINKKVFVEHDLSGNGELAHGSPFEKDANFYLKGLKDYKYSPKQAIALLQQAGWHDANHDGILEKNGRPLRIRLAFEKGTVLEEKIARRMMLDLSAIGIEIDPVPYSKIELVEKLAARTYDAVILEHRFDESCESLYGFFADDKTSFIKFRDLRFKQAFRMSKTTTKPEEIRVLAQRMQAILNRECVASFLFFRWYDYHLFNSGKVDNFYDSQKGEIKPLDEWIFKP